MSKFTVLAPRIMRDLMRDMPAWGVLDAAAAVGGTAIVFWRDTAVADSRAMDAIARIDREIDDIKRSAVVDRQKTSDLTADVKVLLAITQRVEKAVGQLNLRERCSP